MKSKRTISLVLGQILISLVFANLVLETAQAAAPTQLPRPATPSAASVSNSATSICVRMSGLPMTVINSTDSNLILEIPSGATSGTITITTSRGSISTSRFNVIP